MRGGEGKPKLYFDILNFDGKFWEVTSDEVNTLSAFMISGFSYYKNEDLKIVIWKIRDDDVFIDSKMRKVFEASEAKIKYEFDKDLKDLLNEK